ncbi:MAG: SMI1/KNR4 family protein [Chitinophagales bacterium]|nr:SMI1/KNR4 family protein [Chitinophagales bacterium]
MRFTNNEQKLTEKELFEFEKEFNLKLPESYRNVILEYNGGSPEKNILMEQIFYFYL